MMMMDDGQKSPARRSFLWGGFHNPYACPWVGGSGNLTFHRRSSVARFPGEMRVLRHPREDTDWYYSEPGTTGAAGEAAGWMEKLDSESSTS